MQRPRAQPPCPFPAQPASFRPSSSLSGSTVQAPDLLSASRFTRGLICLPKIWKSTPMFKTLCLTRRIKRRPFHVARAFTSGSSLPLPGCTSCLPRPPPRRPPGHTARLRGVRASGLCVCRALCPLPGTPAFLLLPHPDTPTHLLGYDSEVTLCTAFLDALRQNLMVPLSCSRGPRCGPYSALGCLILVICFCICLSSDCGLVILVFPRGSRRREEPADACGINETFPVHAAHAAASCLSP